MSFFQKSVDNFEIEHKTCSFLVRSTESPKKGFGLKFDPYRFESEEVE